VGVIVDLRNHRSRFGPVVRIETKIIVQNIKKEMQDAKLCHETGFVSTYTGNGLQFSISEGMHISLLSGLLVLLNKLGLCIYKLEKAATAVATASPSMIPVGDVAADEMQGKGQIQIGLASLADGVDADGPCTRPWLAGGLFTSELAVMKLV
jgi:hypothetical protein